MSGHRRFSVTALVVLAGVSTSPASSNPLTDLFNPAPKETAAPAPVQQAQDACVLQPGRPTPGQHWVYRIDGHRRCWFQANEATVSVKKQFRRAARGPAVDPEEDDAPPRRKTALNARAQLLSAAQPSPPEQSSPPQSAAPEAIDAAPAPDRGAMPTVPASPLAAQMPVVQLAPDRAPPRSVDVEMLLAASTLDENPATSVVPPAPSVTGPDDWGSMVARAGTALIVLGLVLLVGSMLASQFLYTGRRHRFAGINIDHDGAAPD